MSSEERFKTLMTPIVIYNPYHKYRNCTNKENNKEVIVKKEVERKQNNDYITGLAVGLSF